MNVFNQLNTSVADQNYLSALTSDLKRVIIAFVPLPYRVPLRMVAREWRALIPNDADYQKALPLVGAAAAKAGLIHILTWGPTVRIRLDKTACVAATEGGQLSTLKWLRDKNLPCGFSCYDAAGKNGQIELLKWLLSVRPSMDEMDDLNGEVVGFQWAGFGRALEQAVEYGQLAFLKEAALLPLFRRRLAGSHCDHLVGKAAIHNHFDVTKWLVEEQHISIRTSAEECIRAIKYGNLDYFIWLLPKCSEVFGALGLVSMSCVAAKYGHLHLLKWAHENQHSPLTFNNIIREGADHPEVVAWAQGILNQETTS